MLETDPISTATLTFAPASAPDPLAKLPTLAERLGVKPVSDGHAPSLLLHVRNGPAYDAFDLIGALLDRMDRHAGD